MSARHARERSPDESRRRDKRRHHSPSPSGDRRQRKRSRSPQERRHGGLESGRHKDREQRLDSGRESHRLSEEMRASDSRPRRREEERERGGRGRRPRQQQRREPVNDSLEREYGRPQDKEKKEEEEMRAGDSRPRRHEEERERGGRGRRPRQQQRREPANDSPEREYGRPQDKEKKEEEEEEEEAKKLEEPDFGLSGKLTAETNTFRGQVINYSEPDEARVPKTRWRFYPFKGDEVLPTLYLHRQSAYLIGRDKRVCDMIVEHPSCSKQHAVLQYRLVEYTRDDGTVGRRVRPYLIDLNSTNGCYINNQRIESARYYELKEKDMVKFGFSSREYVLLNEKSKGDESDEEEAKD